MRARLNGDAHDGAEEAEAKRNPAIKLIHHFEECSTHKVALMQGSAVVFDTATAQRHSVALGSPPDSIGEGYVGRFVESWMKRWLPAVEGTQV